MQSLSETRGDPGSAYLHLSTKLKDEQEMAVGKREVILSPRSAGVVRNQSSRRDIKTLERLATELFGSVRVALEEFGVSKGAQCRAFSNSRKTERIPPTSGVILRELVRLGKLTLAWKTESLFTDEEGLPRVLDLHGSKGSFESLARRFFPRQSVPYVLKLARQHADVTSTKSGRVALVGSSVVNTNVANSKARALAQLVRQVDQILLTSTFNFRVANTGKGSRRFERMCHAVISRTQFDRIMQELRPQMHDLLERADAMFRQTAATRNSRGSKCVANVGIYVSRCDEIQRAGYDVNES